MPADRLAAELSRWGPYFAFSVRPSPVVGPWRPISELLDGSGSLDEHYRQVQAALARSSGRAVELRVAVSTGHFGLVSRLVCVAVGAASLGFRLDLADARWQPVSGEPIQLSLPGGAATADTGTNVPMDVVGALTRATAAFSLSDRVLDGNVASAVNGAAASIRQVRPDLADRVLAIARQLSPDAGPAFRRRSCCLIYRIALPVTGDLLRGLRSRRSIAGRRPPLRTATREDRPLLFIHGPRWPIVGRDPGD